MSIETPNNEQENKEQLRRTKLLIVDDEIIYRKSFELAFKKDVGGILTAESLESAKNILKEHKKEIACMITDIELSYKNPEGLELIKFVKENYPDINIIVNSSEQEYVNQGLELGADAGFKKPVDISKMKDSVLVNFEDTK